MNVSGRTHLGIEDSVFGCIGWGVLGQLAALAQLDYLPFTWTMTEWFYSTRLETRTKESNTFASSFVMKLMCIMKVIIEILASVAD